MLFEELADSVLRRYLKRPPVEERGRIISERLRELLDGAQETEASLPAKHPEPNIPTSPKVDRN